MTCPPKQVPKSTITVHDRLVVFTFFACGACASVIGLLSLPVALTPRLFFSVLLSVFLFLSLSPFGWLVLPILFFIFGLFSQQMVLNLYHSYRAAAMFDYHQVSSLFVLVPAVVLGGTHAFGLSNAVYLLFGNIGPSNRISFWDEFHYLILFVLLGFAAVFYGFSS